MEQLKNLMDHIVDHADAHFVGTSLDVGSRVKGIIPWGDFLAHGGFCGHTDYHPALLQLIHSNVSGSRFLGRCLVDHSLIHMTDIRGDELKRKGSSVKYRDLNIPIWEDELIRVENSCLIHSVVHSNCHDLGCLEELKIRDTVSMHYANIHGSPVEGCYLGPFATLDLTAGRDSSIEAFSYVQTGELKGQHVGSGRIWIRSGDSFEFDYRFDPDILDKYVHIEAGKKPTGAIMRFIEERRDEVEKRLGDAEDVCAVPVPASAAVSRYAVVKGKSTINENVFVAPRAYLEDTYMGKGSNAQENCYLIGVRLDGDVVTAHGGKMICVQVKNNVFVGFNSFLRGKPGSPLRIGEGCIVMPHTIIDLEEPLEIPPRHLVWGFIKDAKDASLNTCSLAEFSTLNAEVRRGNLSFKGSGDLFVKAFQHRIKHILEANGAFFADGQGQGHAQRNRSIAYRVVRPHLEGDLAGIYPPVDIHP